MPKSALTLSERQAITIACIGSSHETDYLLRIIYRLDAEIAKLTEIVESYTIDTLERVSSKSK